MCVCVCVCVYVYTFSDIPKKKNHGNHHHGPPTRSVLLQWRKNGEGKKEEKSWESSSRSFRDDPPTAFQKKSAFTNASKKNALSPTKKKIPKKSCKEFKHTQKKRRQSCANPSNDRDSLGTEKRKTVYCSCQTG